MENKKYNARPIVEAGLISGIIIILMLITGYVPLIAFMGTIILPIPVAVLYMRHNIKITITSIVVSTLITAMLFNPVQALISAISFALLGITLGYCFKKDINSTTIIGFMTAASLAVTVITTILTITLIQKMDFVGFFTKAANDFRHMITLYLDAMRESYKNANLDPAQLEQMEATFKVVNADFLISGLGGIILFESFISGIVNYAVAKAVLQKLGYKLRKMVAFTEIYITSFVGLIMTAPVVIGMVIYSVNAAVGKPVFVSGLFLLIYAFFMVGISVVVYFLKNKFKQRNVFIVIFVIVTAFSGTFSIMYLLIGLADILFDFRKINPNRILKKS